MTKKTPFYEKHIEYKAKMVDFAGYRMPLQYKGIISEHTRVRKTSGIFDVSHMGRIYIEGKDALEFTNWIITNDVLKIKPYQALYSVMCYPDGGIVDDLLVYRLPDRILLVVNAANTEKDFSWIMENKRGNVSVKNLTEEIAQLAVQGPKTEEFMQKIADNDLSHIGYYHSDEISIAGVPMLVSRTGYTGEDGFELYFNRESALRIWDIIMEAGKEVEIEPCGLGARDTLRLEMKYCLYGNDINENRNPIEAGLSWVVKFHKDFIGKKALLKIKEEGPKEKLVGFETEEGVPRPHCKILDKNENPIGTVTSGTFSPSLRKGIGMGYVKKEFAKAETEILVDIRGKKYKGEIIKSPFYKNASHK